MHDRPSANHDVVNYTVTFTLDKAFMGESFDQARRYGSRWHLIELVIGTVLPLALVAIGVFEVFNKGLKKLFWLRKHCKGKAANAAGQIIVLLVN